MNLIFCLIDGQVHGQMIENLLIDIFKPLHEKTLTM
jgi:hypothetical protein